MSPYRSYSISCNTVEPKQAWSKSSTQSIQLKKNIVDKHFPAKRVTNTHLLSSNYFKCSIQYSHSNNNIEQKLCMACIKTFALNEFTCMFEFDDTVRVNVKRKRPLCISSNCIKDEAEKRSAQQNNDRRVKWTECNLYGCK